MLNDGGTMSKLNMVVKIDQVAHGFLVTVTATGTEKPKGKSKEAQQFGFGVFLAVGGEERQREVVKHFAFSTVDEMIGFVGALYLQGDAKEFAAT